MSRSVAEKAICEECGVDVRENTYFCYNCGSSIAASEPPGVDDQLKESKNGRELLPVEKPEVDLEASTPGKINSKAKEALDQLADQLSRDNELNDEKAVARAAARRRKARSVKRKGTEYVWEPVDDPPGLLLVLFVLIVVFLAAAAVMITVIWK